MNAFSSLTSYKYPPSTDREDPRLGSLIGTAESLADAQVVILGVPTDEGIRRNGGRTGAAEAPDRIRHHLSKLTAYPGPGFEGSIADLRIVDLGNVTGDSLEAQHAAAREISASLTKQGKFVIALGGGHDVTYPLAAGFAQTIGYDWSLINIDAHLDVRPKKEGRHHSGSSFRLLIDEGHLDAQHFLEFGIQSHAISKAHHDWIIERGGRVRFFHHLIDIALEEFDHWVHHQKHVYVSFDIDAIRAADAPGVSAPSPIGFTSEEALGLCYSAGLSPNVAMMDFVEVNPTVDVDDHTSRLTARMIAQLLLGLSNRAKPMTLAL